MNITNDNLSDSWCHDTLTWWPNSIFIWFCHHLICRVATLWLTWCPNMEWGRQKTFGTVAIIRWTQYTRYWNTGWENMKCLLTNQLMLTFSTPWIDIIIQLSLDFLHQTQFDLFNILFEIIRMKLVVGCSTWAAGTLQRTSLDYRLLGWGHNCTFFWIGLLKT